MLKFPKIPKIDPSPSSIGFPARLRDFFRKIANDLLMPEEAKRAPFPGEIFSADHLEEYAGVLANAQRIFPARKRGSSLLRRARENGKALSEAYRAIARAVQEAKTISPAAEWLVDNFHVVDEQLRDIRDYLPVAFYRDLPKLDGGDFRGFPRIYSLAWEYTVHTDNRVDPETLRRFIRAYQRKQPLTTGELWALSITLRVALIENLRVLVDYVIGSRRARVQADGVADELLGLKKSETADGEFHKIAAEPGAAASNWKIFGDSPFFSAFAVQLFQRLHEQDAAGMPALVWLEEQLNVRGVSAQEIVRQEHQKQASLNVSVRNIITSMRLILELDWKVFFEEASFLEEALRKWPGYPAMDFPSRDLYRHAVEELAKGSGREELDVAALVLQEAASDAACPDPGYVLIGAGRKKFEKSLGYRAPAVKMLGRLLLSKAFFAYPAALLGLAALFTLVCAYSLFRFNTDPGVAILLCLLAVFPLSEGAVAWVNRAVTELYPPHILPRLELIEGVPPECRTLVVIPALLHTEQGIHELVERLDVHYLANSEGDILFALLSDWVDAPHEEMPGDRFLLEIALEKIAELNVRHGPLSDGGARFLLFHRRRAWNAAEGKWMGWERKRGKLNELNRLLRGAQDTTFLIPNEGASEIHRSVRYVITLDSDTRLPKGTATRLVGTLAHPLNRARFDAATGRVTSGFGILQPRVMPNLPSLEDRTPYHWIVSGDCGIDPYAGAVSDVYQDLFGEGSYSGKGIYDVDAFEASLRGRIPENTLLSHDLFEGCFARAGLITDVEVMEDFPSHYLVSAGRDHRWVRGDWQLLPWILGRRAGSVPRLGRWKMLDNLRRSLVAPCAFLALTCGWLLPSVPVVLWTVLMLAALALPDVPFLLESLSLPRRGIAKRSYFREKSSDILRACMHVLLKLVLLAHQAWLMADAILKTIVRVCISHRHLLEWTSSAQAKFQSRRGIAVFYRGMIAAPLLAAAVAAPVFIWGHAHARILSSPLLALWMLSRPCWQAWPAIRCVPNGRKSCPSWKQNTCA